MQESDVIAALQAQRELECDLGDGRKVLMERLSYEAGGVVFRDELTRGQLCVQQVRGWEGVTLGDLGVGDREQADTPIAFTPEIFKNIIFDKPVWLEAIAKVIVDDYMQRLQEFEDNKKKSMTGSSTKALNSNCKPGRRVARKKK